MGTGVCPRRQKGLLQMGFCLVVVACLASGAFLYHHFQQKVTSAEALAVKYKQQQEVLSAQLQVVYEHRSRLERSLQKERGEHKKTKEDFLVYKLEAQEAINKEKQDSMNRYGALSSQHKILKNQNDDVKKQLLDLQLQHHGLKLEHRKAAEMYNQKYSQLQKEKESEVGGLQDAIYKLREESKLLRKAHQEVHSQLLGAQVQMEEFRQLKETLQKMPSFKEVGMARGQPKQLWNGPPPGPGLGPLQVARPKASLGNDDNPPPSSPGKATALARSSLVDHASIVKRQGEEMVHGGQVSHSNGGPQGNVAVGHLAPPQDAHVPPPDWPQTGQRDNPVAHFTRMVNSVQSENQDQTTVQSTAGEENLPSEAIANSFGLPPASEPAQASDKPPFAGSRRDQAVQSSWQDIVNEVKVQMDGEQTPPHYPQSLPLGDSPKRAMADGNQALSIQQRGVELRRANWEARKGGADDGNDLQMDAGMTEKEDNSHSQKDAVIQEPTVPNEAADPAKDPNNQGEDEFEEAELERPDFKEKVGQADPHGHTKGPAKEETHERNQKDGPKKMADGPMDDYQEDQEQDLV